MILVVVPTVDMGRHLPKRPGEKILSVQQILEGKLRGVKIESWVASGNAEAHPAWARVRDELNATLARS